MTNNEYNELTSLVYKIRVLKKTVEKEPWETDLCIDKEGSLLDFIPREKCDIVIAMLKDQLELDLKRLEQYKIR